MIEQIWNGILEFTSQFVIPDWGSLISLLPVFVAILVVLFFGRVALAYATAGPKRRGGGRRKPIAPADIHMPGGSFAPILAGIGSFTLFLGEFSKELIQARRTRRSGIRPQMHRGMKYAGMRAASTANRDHVHGWSVGGFAHDPAMHGKAKTAERAVEQVE